MCSGYSRCVVVLLIALSCLPSSEAQERGSIFYRYEPRMDRDGDGPDGELSTHRVSGRIGYPVISNDKSLLIPDVNLSWDHFDFKGFPLDELDAYGVQLGVTWIYMGFEDRALITRLSPGVFSDFNAITGDDLRLFGMILGVHKLSDTFSYGLGIIYNQDFGEPRVYPAAGFNWQISERVELDMNMPRPKIVYRPSEDTHFSLHGAPAGDKWSLEFEGEDLELILENIRVGVEAEHQFAENFWLALDVGVNFNRSYELEGEGGRDIIDSGADDAPYVRVGVIYR